MRHWLPRILIIASLGLHIFTTACYIRQPDKMAAFTIHPIWIWGILGTLMAAAAYIFWRATFSLLLVIVWSLTILIASDEARVLAHIGREQPEPGPAKPYAKKNTLRICTLNWGGNITSKEQIKSQIELIASYQPDILLLQEIHPWNARLLVDTIYPHGGDYRTSINTAIITRWKIQTIIPSPMRYIQYATIKLPNGHLIDCVNFHLKSACKDIDLWRKSCWKNHSNIRKHHRSEVTHSLNLLKKRTPFPNRPAIIGGDFNAPATDPLHNLLKENFNDSFTQAGTGWANTWHRRIPLQRIDYIYTTPQLKAVRSHTVIAPASDHLMLVSDFHLMP